VVPQVTGHERLNVVVAVVVALLHAKREPLARLGCGGRKSLGQQLLIRQKLVGGALIDQDMSRSFRATSTLAWNRFEWWGECP
jgi:hypothetical protein